MREDIVLSQACFVGMLCRQVLRGRLNRCERPRLLTPSQGGPFLEAIRLGRVSFPLRLCVSARGLLRCFFKLRFHGFKFAIVILKEFVHIVSSVERGEIRLPLFPPGIVRSVIGLDFEFL